MLIKKNVTGKTGSIFECDRCKKELITGRDERFHLAVTKSPRDYGRLKSWDLCKRCYLMLCKGIAKGVTDKDKINVKEGKKLC